MTNEPVTRSRVRAEVETESETAIQCETCGYWVPFSLSEPFDLGPDEGTMYLCRVCACAHP